MKLGLALGFVVWLSAACTTAPADDTSAPNGMTQTPPPAAGAGAGGTAGGAGGTGALAGASGTTQAGVGGGSAGSAGTTVGAPMPDEMSCIDQPNLARITASCTAASGCLLTFNDPNSAEVETCTLQCFLNEGSSDGCARCAAGAAAAAHATCKVSQCNGNLAGCEACMLDGQATEQPDCGNGDTGNMPVYVPLSGACGSVEDQAKLDGKLTSYTNACVGGVCMNETINELAAPGTQPLRQCTSDCWASVAAVSQACADCLADVAMQASLACSTCSPEIQIAPGSAWTTCFDCSRREQATRQPNCLGSPL